MAPRLPPALRDLLDLEGAARAIGPFKLERQLGRGGFAPVWLAKEVYGDKELRTAAVKLFALDPSAASSARRVPGSSSSSSGPHHDAIIDEARALCRVEHPNIVRFYALPIDEIRGVVGLAMEYVAGTSLDACLRDESKLPIRKALDIGIAVARALAAVHAAGLVHRDVKPANVVEANGVYKLIDFGIASAETKRDDAASPRGSDAGTTPARAKKVVLDDLPLEIVGTKLSMLASAYTVDGGVGPDGETVMPFSATGTIGYIDPVCVATSSPAVAASDLYGLGAMLFECLVGKIPAQAAAAEGTGLRGEVLDGRARAPKVRVLDDSVPEALADMIERLIEPERDARPVSADEVASALEALRASLTAPVSAVVAAPPPSLGAIAKPRGRTGIAMWMVGAAAVTAIGAVMVSRGTSRAPASTNVATADASGQGECALGDAEGCTSACNRGSFASCQTLANMYQTSTGVPKDATRAQALYAKACEGGITLACYKLGAMLEAAQSFAPALAQYEKACDAANAQGCQAAGSLLWGGRGAPKDAARAVALFQRACDANYDDACASLGAAYDRGEGVAVDAARAASLYEGACKSGALAACANLATLCVTGRGVAKDEARAAELYRKACDGDTARACQGLGALYEVGLGVAKDPANAVRLYEEACEKKEFAACAALGRLDAFGDPSVRDESGAVSAFQRACEANDPDGCKGLADFYAAGTYVVRNADKARALYAQACDAGSADACNVTSTSAFTGAPDIALPVAKGVALPLALPRSRPTCNCAPGDPLCSCP